MKKILFRALILCGLTAFGQEELEKKVGSHAVNANQDYTFKTVVDLEATPVKDQSRTGTCWSFAGVSFVESEIIRNGGERIDLSEMYVVRMTYIEKAKKYVRMHGKINFAQGGEAPDIFYIMQKYGAVPEEVYTGLVNGAKKHNHNDLESALTAYVDAIIANKSGQLNPKWIDGFTAILDAFLGKVSESFNYNGKIYNARSFADDVVQLNPADYVALTSFTHQPFYAPFILQIPDNWIWSEAYNLPLDDMIEVLDHALENGYSVAWAADVSEKGFSYKNGLAIVPAKAWSDMDKSEIRQVFAGPHEERTITPEIRQAGYNNYTTQDDHGMHFTGMVTDQTGTNFYIVKNSWGEKTNPYRNGYVYASEAYVRYKTISLLMHKDGLQKYMKKKLDL